VDPAFRDEQAISGTGVGPAPAVIEPYRPGQDVERLGDGLVEVQVWPGRRSGEVPAVQAELAAGGRSCSQTADLGAAVADLQVVGLPVSGGGRSRRGS
jgi:hypothetical protein